MAIIQNFKSRRLSKKFGLVKLGLFKFFKKLRKLYIS